MENFIGLGLEEVDPSTVAAGYFEIYVERYNELEIDLEIEWTFSGDLLYVLRDGAYRATMELPHAWRDYAGAAGDADSLEVLVRVESDDVRVYVIPEGHHRILV